MPASGEDQEGQLRPAVPAGAVHGPGAEHRAEAELAGAQQALRQKADDLERSLEVLRATLDATSDGILAVDEAGRVITFNEQFLALWDMPRGVAESMDRQRMLDFACSRLEDGNAFLAETNRIYASDEAQSFDIVQLADGRVLERFSNIQRMGGQKVGRVWSYRDVTERRRTQAALNESNEQFASILNQSPSGVYLVDDEYVVRLVNPKAAPVFAVVGGVVGRDFGEVLRAIWPEERAAELLARFRHTMETGESFFDKGFSERREDRGVQEIYDWEIHRIGLPEGRHGVVCYFMDMSAHVLAQQALRRSEEELRALANSIPNLAWIAAPDGSIDWYNQGWYDYTGTTLEEMQGWGWQSVHRPDFLPLVTKRWQASLESGQRFEMEFPLKGKDGTFRWFLTRVNPVRDESGAIVRWFGTNTDVDEVRKAQETVQEESRILDVLNSTGRTITAKLDLEALVQAVTDAGTELSGAKFGAFFYNVVNREGESFVLYTLSGAPREAFAKFGLPRATPVFSPTFHGEGVVRSDDITQDPRYGTMPPHHGMPAGHLPVRSYLAVSVISRSGEVIGGLFFGHPEVGVFNERSERLISGLAAQAAVAIDNARLYEAAQREIAERKEAEAQLAERVRLSTLRGDVAALLSVGIDVDRTLHGCCELLVQHLDAAFARIWVLQEGTTLVLRASAGLYRHLDGPHARIAMGEYKIGRIALNRRAHLTNDVAHDPNISDPEWAQREGMVAFAGYPLLSEGRVVGVLAIFARQPLSAAVVGDLSPMADAIAAAIERREAEAELRLAKERAESASRAKDSFLAALSHELRTPLTPVLMSAGALRHDERLPAEVRAELAMIERNIGLEARLIDDLLDLTRITHGKLQLREETCDAHSLIGLAVEIVRDDAQAKPVSLHLKLAARRTALRCDPARVQQVVWNLLRNAIKFTPPEGTITIRTRDETDQRLRIEVVDTGIGLSPDAVQRIFKPFDQAGRENDHRFGGLGLGLTIAHAIVDLHGGTISAESPGPGQGATFAVELPRAATQKPGITGLEGSGHRDTEVVARAAEKPLRLLLVEDHEATLLVLKRLLSKDGHHVIAATSVAAAIAAGRAAEFDLIISDMGLPDGTGLELMARLRAMQPALAGIALSGYGMEDDLRRSHEAGFVTHLIKPVDFEQLRRAMRYAIENASRLPRGRTQ